MKPNEEYYKRVGQRVKEARGSMPQDYLASKLHRKQAWLSMVEHGKRPLSPQDAKEIANILKVRWEYILCVDDFRTEEEQAAHIVEFIAGFENGLCALTAYVSKRISDKYSETVSTAENGFKIYRFLYENNDIEIDGNEMDLIHREILDYFEFKLRKHLNDRIASATLEKAVNEELIKLNGGEQNGVNDK